MISALLVGLMLYNHQGEEVCPIVAFLAGFLRNAWVVHL